jgi:hypothetical protein
MATATTIPNVKLRQAFLSLVEQKFGQQPQRVVADQPTRGPARQVYSVDGKTLRLRTNNKPCLMAKVESGDVDAPLPFEGQDLVGITFPADRDGFVVGYLVPSAIGKRIAALAGKPESAIRIAIEY